MIFKVFDINFYDIFLVGKILSNESIDLYGVLEGLYVVVKGRWEYKWEL